MAGHETTANTLAWAWLFLSRHPEVESRLHDELDRSLGGRVPAVADLPRLTYAEHIVTETLRAYPTVWTIGREAIEPVDLGGYRIPAGMTVFMPQWVIHRDARWFDDPLAFRPERWADGLTQRIPRYAYFPFGGGPRICIGNNFAMMEATLILATIAQKVSTGAGARCRGHAASIDDITAGTRDQGGSRKAPLEMPRDQPRDHTHEVAIKPGSNPSGFRPSRKTRRFVTPIREFFSTGSGWLTYVPTLRNHLVCVFASPCRDSP